MDAYFVLQSAGVMLILWLLMDLYSRLSFRCPAKISKVVSMNTSFEFANEMGGMNCVSKVGISAAKIGLRDCGFSCA
jgi:hypothetical protein